MYEPLHEPLTLIEGVMQGFYMAARVIAFLGSLAVAIALVAVVGSAVSDFLNKKKKGY